MEEANFFLDFINYKGQCAVLVSQIWQRKAEYWSRISPCHHNNICNIATICNYMPILYSWKLCWRYCVINNPTKVKQHHKSLPFRPHICVRAFGSRSLKQGRWNDRNCYNFVFAYLELLAASSWKYNPWKHL